MPGARNVPAAGLSRNGALLPVDELRAALTEAGIDLAKPVVTSCGSGVTAAVISLALDSVGHADHRLYDGSWTEWGGSAETPVVTGARLMDAASPEATAPDPIDVTVTFLEMDRAPVHRPAAPYNRQIALLRARAMPLHYYRYLIDRVGRKWHWVNSLRLNDDDLAEVTREDRDIRVLYLDGAPAGFFDLKPNGPSEMEIAYFGMMDHATGQGLGRWFLGSAIDTALVVQARSGRRANLHARPSGGIVAVSEAWLSPGRPEGRDRAADELCRALRQRHALTLSASQRRLLFWVRRSEADPARTGSGQPFRA